MKRYTLLLAVILLAATAQASTMPGLHKGPAELGMGGVTSLYGYNSRAVAYNPALLNRAKFRLDLVNFGFIANDQFFKLAKFIQDHQYEFSHFDSLAPTPIENRRKQMDFINSMGEFDDQWYNLQVAPTFGLTFQHFGLLVASSMQPEAKIDRGVFNPAVSVRGGTDMAAYIGYGNERRVEFSGEVYTLEYGASLKLVNRQEMPEKRIPASKLGKSGDIFEEALKDFQETKSGFGLEVGTATKLSPNWEAAVVAHNLIASYDGKFQKPQVVIGNKYDLKEKLIPNVSPISRWIVAGELDDFFNSGGTSLFYKINFGTEATIYNRILMRGGFHRGYPGFGAGLDLWILKFDYTYFGDELGRKPGQVPAYNHFIQIAVGW